MNLLQRIMMMFMNGTLPDPRTGKGVAVYTALGLGIGMMLANLGRYV